MCLNEDPYFKSSNVQPFITPPPPPEHTVPESIQEVNSNVTSPQEVIFDEELINIYGRKYAAEISNALAEEKISQQIYESLKKISKEDFDLFCKISKYAVHSLVPRHPLKSKLVYAFPSGSDIQQEFDYSEEDLQQLIACNLLTEEEFDEMRETANTKGRPCGTFSPYEQLSLPRSRKVRQLTRIGNLLISYLPKPTIDEPLFFATGHDVGKQRKTSISLMDCERAIIDGIFDLETEIIELLKFATL